MKVSRYVVSAATMLALVALSAQTAAAQQSAASPVRFGLSAGLNIPLSDLSQSQQTGYIINGLVTGTPQGWPFALRGELSYSGFSGKNGIPNMGITSGYVNAVYPMAAADMAPYFIGGIGLNHLSFGGGQVTENDFGLNFGGGFEWQLNSMTTFLELRYYYINTSGSSAQMLPITFGIKF
jgi:Outer membrane protein beta-barrel domain